MLSSVLNDLEWNSELKINMGDKDGHVVRILTVTQELSIGPCLPVAKQCETDSEALPLDKCRPRVL